MYLGGGFAEFRIRYFLSMPLPGLDGMSIRANFYKCGDELQKPHFLSWNPIKIEKPDFIVRILGLWNSNEIRN